jgi:hypothetical protein
MGFFSKLKNAFNPGGDDARILQVGTPGTAIILSLKEAGMTMKTGGTLPKTLLNIEVKVSIPGTDEYVTTIQKMVSVMDIANLKIGAAMYIKADPADKMKVAFDPNPQVNQAAVGNPENIIKEGYKGMAELKFKLKTSQVKNGYSVYAIQFEITREGVDAYTVDKEVPLPEYEPGRFDVGRKLPCLIDFNDKNKLTMEI